MITGIQAVMKNIGESGCYFLCLCKAGGVTNADQILGIYHESVTAGYITPECYVRNPNAVLGLCGLRAHVTYAGDEEANTYPIIERWECNGNAHYCYLEAPGLRYDPWGSSSTVRNGHIKSYRKITVKGD